MRIAQCDADALVLRLQPQADARDRAAGARRAGEAVDPPVHLLPDLLRRADNVRAAVGDIVELVRPDRIVAFLRDAAAGVDEVAGAGIGRRRHQHQLGPQRAQRVHLLAALRLGHHDDRAIALGVGDQRQTDAGIARRAFDDRTAGMQHATRLRILDDAQRRAILHAGARIGEFAFAEDVAAARLARPLQPDEGRVADQGKRVWGRMHAR